MEQRNFFVKTAIVLVFAFAWLNLAPRLFPQLFPKRNAPPNPPAAAQPAEQVDADEKAGDPGEKATGDPQPNDEADAVAFYREDPERFEATGDETAEEADPIGPFPSSAVRRRVIEALRAQRAEAQLERMANAAQNLLRQPLRPLEESNGYKVIPEGFEPPPRATACDRWCGGSTSGGRR